MVRQDGFVALIEEHVVVVHGIARANLGDVPSHHCPLPALPLVGVEEHLHLGPDGQDGVMRGVPCGSQANGATRWRTIH